MPVAILEVAILSVRPGEEAAFEAAFQEAQSSIAAATGYLGHQLKRCIEKPGQYLLLVQWQSLEDHTVGFRQSKAYGRWKALLHRFYDPMPSVEHYIDVS